MLLEIVHAKSKAGVGIVGIDPDYRLGICLAHREIGPHERKLEPFARRKALEHHRLALFHRLDKLLVYAVLVVEGLRNLRLFDCAFRASSEIVLLAAIHAHPRQPPLKSEEHVLYGLVGAVLYAAAPAVYLKHPGGERVCGANPLLPYRLVGESGQARKDSSHRRQRLSIAFPEVEPHEGGRLRKTTGLVAYPAAQAHSSIVPEGKEVLFVAIQPSGAQIRAHGAAAAHKGIAPEPTAYARAFKLYGVVKVAV